MGRLHRRAELAHEARELHDRVLINVWPLHADDIKEGDYGSRQVIYSQRCLTCVGTERLWEWAERSRGAPWATPRVRQLSGSSSADARRLEPIHFGSPPADSAVVSSVVSSVVSIRTLTRPDTLASADVH